MKKLFVVSFLIMFLGSGVSFGQVFEDEVYEDENYVLTHTIRSAVEDLIEGNKNFYLGKTPAGSVAPLFLHPHATIAYREAVANDRKQKPKATILACSDSRAPVEVITGQGINDIFSVRVAGNSFNETELDSALYATGHLEHPTPLVVVLGHRKCGAIHDAVLHMEQGGIKSDLPKALQSIVDVYDMVNRNVMPSYPNVWRYDAHLKVLNDKYLQIIEVYNIRANVRKFLEYITKSKNENPPLSVEAKTYQAVVDGKIRVIGALYHLKKGDIHFYGPHPFQKAKLQCDHPIPVPENSLYRSWPFPK